MRLPLLFFLVAACQLLPAQDVLKLDTTQCCIYSGGLADTALYRFSDSNKVSAWIKEIAELGDAPINFEVVQTNVANVSAVLDGGKRYLLYSLYFVENNPELYVIGALAHELGHHVNAHRFSVERRKIEELEADNFMGYVLSKKRFSKVDIEGFLRKMPSSYKVSFEERRAAVLEGFDRAERSMQIKSLTSDDNSELKGQPPLSFPWPPPSCYTRYVLPKAFFTGLQTLDDVEGKIRRALDANGYVQRSYYPVANGFAMVTQLERYNSEGGSLRDDDSRWLNYPQKDNFNEALSYLRSLVVPREGYFRLFAFVVTNQAFGGPEQGLSKEQAAAWSEQGFNKLPPNTASMPFAADYNVTALVYEFVASESTGKLRQQCSSTRFEARTHLERSGLLKELQTKPIVEEILPTFTFYKCYSNFEPPAQIFKGCGTLGKIDEKIRMALDRVGYAQRSYFSVSNGFVIVTKMEQYEKDGTVMEEHTRWIDYPAPKKFSGLMDYLTSMIVPNKGFFRVFAFVVTDASFKASDHYLSKEEGAAWSGQGANRLPKIIADKSYTGQHVLSVLVYEFVVPESNRKPEQQCPSPLFDAKTHLLNSGLAAGLGF